MWTSLQLEMGFVYRVPLFLNRFLRCYKVSFSFSSFSLTLPGKVCFLMKPRASCIGQNRGMKLFLEHHTVV